MNIAAYQRWFADYDCQRSFDLIEPSQMVVHLMEEVGEIAREVLYLEGYRDPEKREDAIERLSAELGDALVFLTKLALTYGIEMDDVVSGIVAKAEKRWPLDVAGREMGRYMAHQDAAMSARAAVWRERQSEAPNRKSPVANPKSQSANPKSQSANPKSQSANPKS
jgi:NTP pyrophosphatase (non-canonical NTP hydrolase)